MIDGENLDSRVRNFALFLGTRVEIDRDLFRRWAVRWRAKGWVRGNKPVPNADLWEQLLDLCEGHEVSFEWVKGHAGTVENERCDVLSVLAARGPDLPVDTGYEDPRTRQDERLLDVEGDA